MATRTVSDHWQTAPGNLGSALLLALLLHGVLIFGLGFHFQRTTGGASSLEVTLATHPASEPPRNAELIAASDQLGSGDSEHSSPVTSDQVPLIDAAELRNIDPLANAIHPPPGAAIPLRAVVATRDGSFDKPIPQGERNSQPASEPLRHMREIASLRARLDLQKQAYGRIPRTLVLTAASARAADEADYLYHWIEWVERIGNEHYPEEARHRQLFGDLRLAVAIGRDGGVEQVEILESSGQRVLDQAAVRIVRLAAPFAPIPATINADRIEVIRTWRFMPGEVFATRVD